MSGLSLVFASGGSGGHIFPAVAVADAVRARNPRITPVFVGSDRSIEREIAARHGYERFVLPAASLNCLWRRPRTFLRTQWDAYRQAREFLQDRGPAAVIGCGSFSGAPLVYAASKLNIPVILLEQNVVPGRATSWLSRRADAVCVSFAESCRKLPRKTRTPVTGNPVRREIAQLAQRNEPRVGCRPTLLILGGSQGARAVNNGVCSVATRLKWLLEDWQIIHQTGWNDAARIRAAMAVAADRCPKLRRSLTTRHLCTRVPIWLSHGPVPPHWPNSPAPASPRFSCRIHTRPAIIRWPMPRPFATWGQHTSWNRAATVARSSPTCRNHWPGCCRIRSPGKTWQKQPAHSPARTPPTMSPTFCSS